MSAGTLTLTNNSPAVTGVSTTFSTELAAGDFIVVTVGGVPYTLAVKTVNSNTSLTLVSNYTGPTQAGAAWSAVPRVALNMVTAALVAQSAEALRGLNYDKQNWQQVFSGTGTITVKLPDGSTYTGPAWSSITTSLSNKAAKGANNDITSLSGLTTVLSLAQGGTGSSTPFGSTAGSFCQGNDSRLGTVNGKSGGTISSNVSINGNAVTARGGGLAVGGSSDGNYRIEINATPAENTTPGGLVSWLRYWWYQDYVMVGCRRAGDSTVQSLAITFGAANGNFVFNPTGNATASGSWTNNSDKRLKHNIQPIDEPLVKMKALTGCTWDRLDGMGPGLGFIAQDVQSIFPDAVYEGENVTLVDGSIVEKCLSVDVSGVAAALHHEAILALMAKLENLQATVDALKVER